MSLAILFHFLCAQHVSDINISIFRSLRLCWWNTTLVILFSVRCVLQAAKWTPPNTRRNNSSNTQRTENKTTDVVIHQHSRKLLKMDILMSETCWAHNKWNKIASDIKLVFYPSTIAMMHGPINIRFDFCSLLFFFLCFSLPFFPHEMSLLLVSLLPPSLLSQFPFICFPSCFLLLLYWHFSSWLFYVFPICFSFSPATVNHHGVTLHPSDVPIWSLSSPSSSYYSRS